MAKYPRQTKRLELDLRRIPITSLQAAKDDVGEFIRDEILRSVSQGRSPVEGRGAFHRLDKTYAQDSKGGSRLPNLELQGDLLDALEYRVTDSGVEVGIFESSQQGKSDGHNNFSGDSKLPTRRFIPEESEQFQARIMTGVRQILDQYREDPFDSQLDTSALALANALVSQQDIEIDDIVAGLLGDSIV